ncbi:MAG: glycosyltransferase [Elusimicrobiota bacterium]
MKKAGLNSAMLVYSKQSSDACVVGAYNEFTPLERLRWKFGRLGVRLERCWGKYSMYFRTERGVSLSLSRIREFLPFKPDVIVAHWVGNFMTVRLMCQLSREMGVPLYWYMLDMAALTGGCHYAFDCRGYMQTCGHCPQIGRGAGASDASFLLLQEKLCQFDGVDITAVVPSLWLKRQAEESTLFAGRPIRHIPLGIDVDVFKPSSVPAARALLGLPQGKKIVFFGAHNFREERKGISYLLQALRRLYAMLRESPALRNRVLILSAGAAPRPEELGIPFDYKHVGVLRGDVMLTAAYQSADIFVNASIEDTGPMMLNEAIVCGTPVVAFDMGVAPDLVHTGKTGYRAVLRNANDMANGMRELLEMDDTQCAAMRQNCRNLGLALCHPDVQVKAFVALFASRPNARTASRETMK